MTYVVAGITGHTGSVVAESLLEAGHQVRAPVRSVDRANAWRDRGVELIQTDLADGAGLADVLRGAEGAYLLLPPDFAAADLFASLGRVSDALIDAVEQARVPRVVLLSSVAADQPSGTGPIRSLRPLEQAWRDRDGVTFLRAAYFQDNLVSVLEPATGPGVFPSFVDPDRPFPMVATPDIGRRAAALLTAEAPLPRVVHLAGPEDYSMRQAATILGGLLGKDLDVVRQPPEAIVPILKGMGAAHIAELYAELNAGMDDGTVRFEPGIPIERGETPLRATFERLLGR
jgi:uncharacterized protein YbjT (DUF2867 family)